MNVQPYLFLDGRCEEAIAFYRQVLGAEVIALMRLKEHPPALENVPPGSEEKVMHAAVRIGEATVLMSDGRCEGRPRFEGFSLSLTVASDADAQRIFSALGEGGQVQMPLGQTFFSSSFGMVADRFGVGWIVYVAP